MDKNYTDAPDTNTDLVTDHPWVNPDEPWGLCKTCGLGRAAHSDGPVYEPEAKQYRCPDCVDQGIEYCRHYGEFHKEVPGAVD